MRTKLFLSVLLVAFCAGCRMTTYEQRTADGSTVKLRSFSLFSDSTLKGLTAGTNGLSLLSGSTAANPEAITAAGEATGNAAGAAARTILK